MLRMSNAFHLILGSLSPRELLDWSIAFASGLGPFSIFGTATSLMML
jgi:hypothetical protein